jgi:hypothetical protein
MALAVAPLVERVRVPRAKKATETARKPPAIARVSASLSCDDLGLTESRAKAPHSSLKAIRAAVSLPSPPTN